MRKLEIYSHRDDKGPGTTSHVRLSDGVMTVESSVADVVSGETKRLQKRLGRRPTNEEVFNHLAHWSNGYTAGRELVD